MDVVVKHALIVIYIFSLAATASAGEGPAHPPTFSEVSKKLDDLYRSQSAIATMEIEVKTKTRSRTLTMKSWSKGREKSLILITKPAREAGNATLKVGNNIWNYVANISRTIRIPPSGMLGSWMGTDFTNDDLVREASYEQDFEAGPATWSSKQEAWLFEMRVKPNVVGRWDRIDWFVDKNTLLPKLAEYFDRNGQIARTMRFSDIKELSKKLIPTVITLEPSDKPDNKTTIRYLTMEFDLEISESKFSLSELERK